MKHARVDLVVDEQVDAPNENGARRINQRAMNRGKLVRHGETEKVVEGYGAPVQKHLRTIKMQATRKEETAAPPLI